MTKKYILLDGTGSTGKSTICAFFSTKNFSCYHIDDYYNCNDKPTVEFYKAKNEYYKLMKKIKNNYGETDDDTILNKTVFKTLYKDMIKSKQNVLIDFYTQFPVIKLFEEKKLIHNLYIINVFSNLNSLARNLELRRKKGNPRAVSSVFYHFATRYIKTTTDDPNKIEIVNRNNFKEVLMKYFKYAFLNEDELIYFSNYIFKKMNITDDDDHYIKVRPTIIYDYLLNTTNKSKQKIYKELEENVFNNEFFFSKTKRKTQKKTPQKNTTMKKH